MEDLSLLAQKILEDRLPAGALPQWFASEQALKRYGMDSQVRQPI